MKPADRANLFRTIKAGLELVDDRQASEGVDLYPEMQYDGSLIKGGMRIKWHGMLKRAAVDLWDTKENNPDNAPTLWEDISYKNGHRVIPNVITSTLAFAKDELGWWGDKLYRSLIPANVYTPEQYAAGWEEVV